jgi:hypothetical protein
VQLESWGRSVMRIMAGVEAVVVSAVCFRTDTQPDGRGAEDPPDRERGLILTNASRFLLLGSQWAYRGSGGPQIPPLQ